MFLIDANMEFNKCFITLYYTTFYIKIQIFSKNYLKITHKYAIIYMSSVQETFEDLGQLLLTIFNYLDDVANLEVTILFSLLKSKYLII